MYTLTWEQYCTHDLGNAMAIRDKGNIIRAYLARDDAKTESTLCYVDIPINVIYCQPYTEAHVVKQQLGPQHECCITFSAKQSDMNFIYHVLNGASVKYYVH